MAAQRLLSLATESLFSLLPSLHLEPSSISVGSFMTMFYVPLTLFLSFSSPSPLILFPACPSGVCVRPSAW